MVLGLRYPKVHEFSQVDVSPAGGDTWRHHTTTVVGTRFSYLSQRSFIPVAPNRYSEVRKVIFWMVVKKDANSPHTTYPARLRVAPVCATPGNQDAESFILSPGNFVRTEGANDVWTSPGFNSNDLYPVTDQGTFTNLPVGTLELTQPGHLISIEFDRFDPLATRFFTDWDAIIDDDEYLGFRLVTERTDGTNYTSSTATELQAHSFGVTIVQAPAGVNNTCTIVPTSIGEATGAACPTTYASGANRAYFLRWHPNDWDNVSSVHMLLDFFALSGNPRNINVALHLLTGQTPEVRTIQGAEQNFTDNLATRAVGDTCLWRSTDIYPLLQAGGEGVYQASVDEQVASSIPPPILWFEIIQKNFNKTTCFHSAGTSQRSDLNTTNYGAPGCGFFDPTWYQAFPDDRILNRKIYAAFRHLNPALPSNVALYLDSDLESNHTQLATSSFTIVRTTPELSSTPDPDTGIKLRDAPITGTDPLELAGRRKLIWGLDNTAPVATGNPGDMGIYYTLNVPNSEFLDIGDIFEVSAFAPEGCAATSAGLGDPGKLYISNGSSIPKMFDPEKGAIDDAGVPTPFPDELPSYVVTDTAQSPEGGLPDGTYTYRYTLRNCCTGKESDPNPDDIVVVVSGASPAGKVTFSFAGVRIPSDTQICEICLYRTVQGGDFPVMAKVGCFNIDETSVFADDLADSELDFFNDSLSILNAPMPCVPYIVSFRNRIFGAGDIPILSPAGTVSVVNGSNEVIGSDDVDWDRCLEGKYIQVGADCRKYEIDRVLPPIVGVSPPYGRLQLVEEYEGSTSTGETYRICGRPNRLYYSEPLEGGCWPVINFIDVEPGDGDRIMGLASNFDRLVIYKRNKTYVMTFNEFPALEVIVPARVSSDIGGVAPRSYAQYENGTVGLADRGLCIFDGRGVTHVPESDQANDIFVNPDNPRYVRRDDLGRVIDAVGVFYPKREQYLLLLPTKQTSRGCNLMYVWDTGLRNVTLYEFCQEFQAMVVGKDSEGNQRVYLGDTNGFVWLFDTGDTDGAGVPGTTGTLRGTVTSSGLVLGVSCIDDSSASFLEGGLPELAGLSGTVGLTPSLGGDNLALAGACIHLRAPGETLWQSRYIYASTKTRLYVTPSISSLGDDLTGWEYMIGAIDFEAVFKPFNYGSDDYTKRNWRHILVHEIEQFHSKLDIELRADFADEDQFEGDIQNDDGELGRQFFMDYKTGKQIGRVEKVVHTYLQIVMNNFAPEEPIRIINHVLATTPRESRS